jgi:hypothetical protein
VLQHVTGYEEVEGRQVGVGPKVFADEMDAADFVRATVRGVVAVPSSAGHRAEFVQEQAVATAGFEDGAP